MASPCSPSVRCKTRPAKWVTVHRMHHVFSDEQPDPHSPLVNFFWSHFDWLFYHNTATRIDQIDAEVCA